MRQTLRNILYVLTLGLLVAVYFTVDDEIQTRHREEVLHALFTEAR